MKHLRLTHGKSYRGYDVFATHNAPDIFVSPETAEKLLKTGYFEEIPGDDIQPPPVAPTGTIDALDTMGVMKLRDYAKGHGLLLSWVAGTDAETIRADIRDAMQSANSTTEI